jgi:hypothetical protein
MPETAGMSSLYKIAREIIVTQARSSYLLAVFMATYRLEARFRAE